MAKADEAVGGTVVEVSHCKTNQGAVYIRFCSLVQNVGPHQKQKFLSGSVLVYRSDKAEKVEFGDYVWYIGKRVMWTPKAHTDLPEGQRSKAVGKTFDIKLDRIGGVNLPHPDGVVEVTYPLQRK